MPADGTHEWYINVRGTQFDEGQGEISTDAGDFRRSRRKILLVVGHWLLVVDGCWSFVVGWI